MINQWCHMAIASSWAGCVLTQLLFYGPNLYMCTPENTRSIVDVISWAIPEKLLISVQASFPKLIKCTIDPGF